MFGYSCTAKCPGSHSAAILPCLTQRVEHFAVFQVLYKLYDSSAFANVIVETSKEWSFSNSWFTSVLWTILKRNIVTVSRFFSSAMCPNTKSQLKSCPIDENYLWGSAVDTRAVERIRDCTAIFILVDVYRPSFIGWKVSHCHERNSLLIFCLQGNFDCLQDARETEAWNGCNFPFWVCFST